MLKGFLLVGIGSFLGGGLRFLVSRMTAEWVATPFPLATLAVNIIGCLVIGFVSGLPLGGWLSADTRLILTTGFCGGFTTFSTFMNENTSLMKNGDFTMAALYMFASIAIGFVAVVAGHQLAKICQ